VPPASWNSPSHVKHHLSFDLSAGWRASCTRIADPTLPGRSAIGSAHVHSVLCNVESFLACDASPDSADPQLTSA
jgi:hypothetical protein